MTAFRTLASYLSPGKRAVVYTVLGTLNLLLGIAAAAGKVDGQIIGVFVAVCSAFGFTLAAGNVPPKAGQ